MGEIEELICLGDSIYEYRFSNEVVQLLKDREAHVILGNHEECFFGPHGARARARGGIDPALAEWLANRPHRAELAAHGRTVLLVHSTPWEPRGTYVHPPAGCSRFAEAEADIALRPYPPAARPPYRQSVGNQPSSAGRRGARPRNGRQLSCAVLDVAARRSE